MIDHDADLPPGTVTVVWPEPSTVSPGTVTKNTVIVYVVLFDAATAVPDAVQPVDALAHAWMVTFLRNEMLLATVVDVVDAAGPDPAEVVVIVVEPPEPAPCPEEVQPARVTPAMASATAGHRHSDRPVKTASVADRRARARDRDRSRPGRTGSFGRSGRR